MLNITDGILDNLHYSVKLAWPKLERLPKKLSSMLLHLLSSRDLAHVFALFHRHKNTNVEKTSAVSLDIDKAPTVKYPVISICPHVLDFSQ